MKPDDLSESNPKTDIFIEENQVSSFVSSNNICVKFSDSTSCNFDISNLSCINPIFFARMMNQTEKVISLPPEITKDILMEYLFIIKNGIGELEDSETDDSKKVMLFLKTSDFFQNEEIPLLLIQNVILSKLTKENALIFLEYSHSKLNRVNFRGNVEEEEWFNVFLKSLEMIGKDPLILINNVDIINKLDSKVVYELLQKCSSHLLLGNYYLLDNEVNNARHINSNNEIEELNYFETGRESDKVSDNDNDNGQEVWDNNNIIDNKEVNYTTLPQLEKLIQYLYKVYDCQENFFELLTHEYMYIYSNSIIKELQELPIPTFQIQIPYDFENYFYEEYPINLMINNKTVILVLVYQPNDDSFNVSIKLGEKTQRNDKHCFQIFSFVSVVQLNGDLSLPNSVQTNIKSFSNNKSMYNVFKFPNFKVTFNHKNFNKNKNCIFPQSKKFHINNEGIINRHIYTYEEEDSISINQLLGDYFEIRIHLKLCFVYSLLASYLLQNFSVLAYNKSINKLPKQLMLLIIKSRYIRINKEDDIMTGLINWLDDQINIKDDITEVFDVIHWENVKEELIFEFVMKYCHMMSKTEYEQRVVKIINAKFIKGDNSFLNKILMSIYEASKKMDYGQLFSQKSHEEKMIYFLKKKESNISVSHITSEDDNSRNSNGAPFESKNDSSKTHICKFQKVITKTKQINMLNQILVSSQKNNKTISIPIPLPTNSCKITKKTKSPFNLEYNPKIPSCQIRERNLSAQKMTPLKQYNQQMHINTKPNSRNKFNQINTSSFHLSKSQQKQSTYKSFSYNNSLLSNNATQTNKLTTKSSLINKRQNSKEKVKLKDGFRYYNTNVFLNSKPCSIIGQKK